MPLVPAGHLVKPAPVALEQEIIAHGLPLQALVAVGIMQVVEAVVVIRPPIVALAVSVAVVTAAQELRATPAEMHTLVGEVEHRVETLTRFREAVVAELQYSDTLARRLPRVAQSRL